MRVVQLRIFSSALLAWLIAGPAFAQQKEGTASQTPKSSATTAAPAKAAPAKASTTAKSTPAKSEASASAKATPAKGPRTIIGEVVDPACWVINGAKGEGHKECLIACAKAGQTLAILEKKTNKIYILASERPGEDPNKGIVDYAGQSVLVKGKIYTRGGLMAIQVASIEPYTAAK